MTFYNGTPHSISVYQQDAYTFDSVARKNILIEGAKPLLVIAPSGRVLNVQFETSSHIIDGICFSVSTVKSIDSVQLITEDYIIGSKIFADAAKGKGITNVISISGAIFDKVGGSIVGCSGFFL